MDARIFYSNVLTYDPKTPVNMPVIKRIYCISNLRADRWGQVEIVKYQKQNKRSQRILPCCCKWQIIFNWRGRPGCAG